MKLTLTLDRVAIRRLRYALALAAADQRRMDDADPACRAGRYSDDLRWLNGMHETLGVVADGDDVDARAYKA